MSLGARDYSLVGIQFLLFTLYGIDFRILDFVIPVIFRNIALIFAFLGACIVLLAILQLNKNLSPFPSPKSDSMLVETGLYKYIRHPIYAGLMLAAYGYAIFSGSGFRFLISVILYVFFYSKTKYEEAQLMKRYKSYSSYKKRTGRFLPKL